MHSACIDANAEVFSAAYAACVDATIDAIDERIVAVPENHELLGIPSGNKSNPQTPLNPMGTRVHDVDGPRLVESSARKLFQDFESNMDR